MSNEEIPNGFKMTELGPLPEEWKVVRLNKEDIFSYENGIWKGEKPPLVECPIIRNTNFRNDGFIDFSEVAIISIEKRHIVKKKLMWGDIVIERSGGGPTQPVGRVVFFNKSDGIYCFSNFTSRLRVIDKSHVDSRYLHLYLLFFYISGKTIELQRRTTGIRNLAFNDYKNSLIPLPPLPEQCAIAKVLSTVQEAKERTDAVISATKELKKSLMKHLFCYGPVSLEEAENVPLKETEIGLVPEEWDVVRLGDVVEQRKETINPEDGDWKYVGLEHIDPGESRLKKWGFSSEVRSSKSKFYPRDVLYGKLRPYLDKGVLADFEGICSTDIIVIKPKENLNDSLLSYLIHKNDFRDYATSTMTGVNHPRTSWRALSQFFIPLPPLLEQQKIASILSAVDEKIEKEETKKKALEELFKSLLNNLMTGKLRANGLKSLMS